MTRVPPAGFGFVCVAESKSTLPKNTHARGRASGAEFTIVARAYLPEPFIASSDVTTVTLLILTGSSGTS